MPNPCLAPAPLNPVQSLQPSLQLLMPLLGLRKQQVVLLGEQVRAGGLRAGRLY